MTKVINWFFVLFGILALCAVILKIFGLDPVPEANALSSESADATYIRILERQTRALEDIVGELRQIKQSCKRN